MLSCQPTVHLPKHWVPQSPTSTKGKQTLVISPQVHLFSQSSSPHIHVAVIRTKSEQEPRLGEEEVLSLTSTAAWELLSTRASIEVELKKPKQVPSEAARHTLHIELEQQVLLYRLPRQRKHLQVVINIHTEAWHKKKKSGRQIKRAACKRDGYQREEVSVPPERHHHSDCCLWLSDTLSFTVSRKSYKEHSAAFTLLLKWMAPYHLHLVYLRCPKTTARQEFRGLTHAPQKKLLNLP